MKIGQLPYGDLRKQLKYGTLTFSVGDFDIRLKSRLSNVARSIYELYDDYSLRDSGDLADFYIELLNPSVIRSVIRPQVCFSNDGFLPFKPLPANQAFASFEWGLNWCVATTAHDSLVVHAGVVERNGSAAVFPGTPGSGKSTLMAALMCRGWRLLSDEMTILGLEDGLITPFPRPVSLKNESIDIIKRFSSETVIGKSIADTSKGTIAHLKPSPESTRRASERAAPRAFIFPKYEAGASTALLPVSEGYGLMDIASNSFNYHILGKEGFEALTRLPSNCEFYSLRYHQLEEAVAILDELLP